MTGTPVASRSIIRDAIRGALCGIPATAAMTMPMMAAKRMGLIHEQAPERITRATLSRAGVRDRTGGRATDVLAAGSHLAIGAAAGALYGAAESRRPERLPPIAAGMVFGALVWAVSYIGWLPALGLMPPPEEDEPARPALMLLSHLIFGAVLAKLLERRPAGGARAIIAE